MLGLWLNDTDRKAKTKARDQDATAIQSRSVAEELLDSFEDGVFGWISSTRVRLASRPLIWN